MQYFELIGPTMLFKELEMPLPFIEDSLDGSERETGIVLIFKYIMA